MQSMARTAPGRLGVASGGGRAARAETPVLRPMASVEPAPHRPRRYALLRVLTVIGPLAFLWVVDVIRHTVFAATLHTVLGTVEIGVVLLVAVVLFSHLVFRTLDGLQDTIVHQSERMAALEEHDRLAREINDGFLQRMYGVGLRLQTALLTADGVSPATAEQMRLAVEELDRTIEAMRAYLLAAEP